MHKSNYFVKLIEYSLKMYFAINVGNVLKKKETWV